MAPPSTGAARRAAAPQPRPSTRRPPLRVFQPEPRRRTRRGRSRRAPVWLAVSVIVGSLLAVVVGDTLVAQDQVRLAKLQSAIGSAQAAQKTMQTEVAQLAAPDRVVQQGIALGLTAPAQVVNLPEVPLNVALPVPDTTPVATAAPASTAAAGRSATPATAAPPSTAAPASTAARAPSTTATTTPTR
jgi:hypothetical protein